MGKETSKSSDITKRGHNMEVKEGLREFLKVELDKQMRTQAEMDCLSKGWLAGVEWMALHMQEVK